MDQGWVKVIGIGGLVALAGTAAWQSLSPGTKRRIDTYLGELWANYERQRLETEVRQRAASLPPPLPPTNLTWIDEFRRDWDAGIQALSDQYSSTPLAPPAELLVPVAPADSQWHKAVAHPAIILILGKRGSGKSALAYRLLELFRYRLTPYLVGAPVEARNLLPEWVGVAPSLEEVPAKSIVLVFRMNAFGSPSGYVAWDAHMWTGFSLKMTTAARSKPLRWTWNRSWSLK